MHVLQAHEIVMSITFFIQSDVKDLRTEIAMDIIDR